MSQSRSLLTTLSAVVASAIACNGNPIAPNATKIPGVTVQILDSPNTNRTATTGTDGAYQMYDLQVGTFTMQFSKAGYVTLNRSFTLTGDRFNDASVTLVKSPS